MKTLSNSELTLVNGGAVSIATVAAVVTIVAVVADFATDVYEGYQNAKEEDQQGSKN